MNMSRAFVQESDDNFDDVPAIKDPLPPGVKNYMTPEGAEKLRKEFQELQHREYPSLQKKLSSAVKQGEDLKEEAQANMRRRLREMERRRSARGRGDHAGEAGGGRSRETGS